MRTLFSELSVPDPVVQNDSGQCHRQPQQKVLRTDLAQEIARKPAVIPDVPAESQIDDSAGQEL